MFIEILDCVLRDGREDEEEGSCRKQHIQPPSSPGPLEEGFHFCFETGAFDERGAYFRGVSRGAYFRGVSRGGKEGFFLRSWPSSAGYRCRMRGIHSDFGPSLYGACSSRYHCEPESPVGGYCLRCCYMDDYEETY